MALMRLAGRADIYHDFDWFNGISDGRSLGNGERGNHRISHVSVSGRCFPGDVLYITHIHLHWSISCNSICHRKCCIDGLMRCDVFHRFGSLSAIFYN